MSIVFIIVGLVGGYVFEFFILAFLRLVGFYIIVPESTALVYMLFGKVVAVIDEPGIHFLWLKLLWRAPIINFFGKVHRVDLRLDQRYLRSQPVNSEEGAPMGIGVWYEMYISDPVSYLFKNTDPEGSLAANVSTSTVRCLSNMPLAEMLGDRHAMSQAVRVEVSGKSGDWGYQAGSVYIRKVHFRDSGMIRQIESKVVNQLRQVTASIKQDGENQVNVITSSAQRTAAAETAKAAATRPKIVGEALQQIAQDPEVSAALFDILECQRILETGAEITLLPSGGSVLSSLIAANGPSTEPMVANSGSGRSARGAQQ